MIFQFSDDVEGQCECDIAHNTLVDGVLVVE